ncbi:ribosome biogenesis GTPase YqeH [Tepidibacillus marianensis]|uniref:ribosome biogenesis GTPase YqeH n=1 Tax=Tepidibacillus marianensis TaxID=3131995 RepID=UPI0030CEBE08
MTEMKYCEGCGVELQTADKNKAGYIPSSALEKENLICQRCFRIKNYNEVIPIQMDENEFLKILNSIGETNSYVVQIVDLFDIDGTLIFGLPRFIGKNPYIILANKIDLFPKAMNQERIKQWLRRYLNDYGLYPEEIFLISAEKNIGFDDVIDYLAFERGNRDVFVVGATNVGKSSFINQLIKRQQEEEDYLELTTSRYPGTTLNIVRIPLDDGHDLIDTPGIVNHKRLSEWVDPKTLKAISPNKTVKPKVYQLNGEQTLFFGGLARIDQVNQARNNFVCYLSNAMEIHRTKLSHADEIYVKHLGELLQPPSYEEAKQLPPLTKHSFRYTGGNKIDIVISGLGWIAIDGEPTTIDVYVPKGIGVHQRDALI